MKYATEEERIAHLQESRKAYYAKKRDEAIAYSARWRKEHKEEYARQRRLRYAERYGKKRVRRADKNARLTVEEIVAYFRTPESRASVLWILQHKRIKNNESPSLP